MLEFIVNNALNKQQSYIELKTDLLRFSTLLKTSSPYSFFKGLPNNIRDFLSKDKLVKDYYKEIEVLCSTDLFFRKFHDKLRRNPSKRSLKFADFFCGCGGLSEGFIQAGFYPFFANEKDPNFAESYYLNHNIKAQNCFLGDIDSLNKTNRHLLDRFLLEDLDIAFGGPPCQGYSSASKYSRPKSLIEDPRNFLYKDFIQVLSVIKPKFVLIENVKGIKKNVDDIVNDIKKHLGEEYNVAYLVLTATDFGVPQTRSRFFILANRIGVSSSNVLGDVLQNNEKYKNEFCIDDALEHLPKLEPRTDYSKRAIDDLKVGIKIRKNPSKKSNKYLDYINKGACNFVLNHRNRYNQDRDIKIFKTLPNGCNAMHESIAHLNEYRAEERYFADKYYKLKPNYPSRTITAHMSKDCNAYIHPFQPRGLSAREAARIQSFSDDYFFRGPASKWYTQIGNAVPVKMSFAIAKSIKKFL